MQSHNRGQQKPKRKDLKTSKIETQVQANVNEGEQRKLLSQNGHASLD
jgi:hypothetical protein